MSGMDKNERRAFIHGLNALLEDVLGVMPEGKEKDCGTCIIYAERISELFCDQFANHCAQGECTDSFAKDAAKYTKLVYQGAVEFLKQHGIPKECS